MSSVLTDFIKTLKEIRDTSHVLRHRPAITIVGELDLVPFQSINQRPQTKFEVKRSQIVLIYSLKYKLCEARGCLYKILWR